MAASSFSSEPYRIGRYELHQRIAAGGMGAVHLGRMMGTAGFSRTVAIKRMRASLAEDPEFVHMFLDEARIASRVRHPNVVSVLDVIAEDDELLLIMEHIHGVSLAQLSRFDSSERMPFPIVSSIVMGVLLGLHAAHEAKDEDGEPLHIVHRDVSPQNILVGADGVTRVLDFGIATSSVSRPNDEAALRGKIAYMSPEQLRKEPVDSRSDVHAVGVVLWELLTGRRLHAGKSAAEIAGMILHAPRKPPSILAPDVSSALDALCMRALAPRPAERFASAREMAAALSRALAPASTLEVGDYVGAKAGEDLLTRAAERASIEERTVVRGPGASFFPAAVASSGEATETDLSIDGPPPEAPALRSSRQTRSTMETALIAEQRDGAAPEKPRSTTPSPAISLRRLLGALSVMIGVAAALVFFEPRGASSRSLARWPDVSPPAELAASLEHMLSTPPSATSAEPVATKATSAPSPSLRLRTGPARVVAPPKPPPPVADPCDPPYTVDAHGDKRFKPGCFR